MRPMAAERSPGKGRRRPTLVAVPTTQNEHHRAQDAGDAAASDTAGDPADPTDPAGGTDHSAPALDAERLSDVDEWGRSQHLRDILAKLYDPIYDPVWELCQDLEVPVTMKPRRSGTT